jgi:hypothetical protein
LRQRSVFSRSGDWSAVNAEFRWRPISYQETEVGVMVRWRKMRPYNECRPQ